MSASCGDRQRAATGIPGLDQVLGGGFPRNRIYLVEGDPGVGKTTLGLQFLLEGTRAGESCLYVTLSETLDELRAVAASHGWSLDGLSVFELPVSEGLNTDEENTLFHPSEVELAETTARLIAEIEKVRPSRLVFDSLSEIRLLAQSPLRYRRQVCALKQFFVGRQITVLMVDDRTSEAGDLQLQSVGHGVLSLEQLSPLYGAERRRIRVLKLRGVRFRGGFHDMTIEIGGVRVFPRLVAAEHRESFARARLSSGVPGLDALVGGGLDYGTSTLLMGPAGTGKSTVAMQYVHAAASAGVRVAMFCFDESIPTVLARAAGTGRDLRPFIEAGTLDLRQVDPAEMTPGEFSHAARHAVEQQGVRLLVIDSLNGYFNAMPEEHFLTLQLHELLTYLGQMGALSLLVMAQHGLMGPAMQSPIDVSYLADAVVMFRYYEIRGRLCKAISMLKKRTGNHEASIRELTITSGGVAVGPPLEGLRGVMTGLPVRAEGGGSDR
jgi:circadian clock protein KaiC